MVLDCCSWEDLLPSVNEPLRFLEVVGVMGDDVSLIGEVGESRSREPVESFVRFFLRKPRVGIRAVGRGMLPSPSSDDLARRMRGRREREGGEWKGEYGQESYE